MTPEEEAYEEALRRIQEAEETGALELDLSGGLQYGREVKILTLLNRFPPALARLTSLLFLNVSGCEQLGGDLTPLAGLASLRLLSLEGCRHLSGDLSPLAGLSSLRSLELFGCKQLSGDLSPLAGLSSLQSLNLSDCGFRRFAPVESLLPAMEELRLFGCKFDDLPPEVCGRWGNVLNHVRAHYADLKSGQRIDAEVRSCSSVTVGSARRNCTAACAGKHSILVCLPPTESNLGRRPWSWMASQTRYA
jgi:hypothetical protein